MKDDKILHKWINGELTAEELAQFKQRPEYDSLARLYQHTEDLEVPAFDESAMLQDILREKKVQSPPPARRRFLNRWVQYAAAAIALALAVWFIWPNNSLVEYDLARQERLEETLPDGSTFVLNAESRLSYDAKAWEDNRRLNLQGEAFFRVQKGSTFTVMTPGGEVRVLGTSFNVRARREALDVECQSGKVAVYSKNGTKLSELTPGRAVRVLDGGQIIEEWQVPVKDAADWISGISRFRKVPLHVVLAEIERQYNVNFDARTVNVEQVLSCNIPHSDLELALKSCLSPLSIPYAVENDMIKLTVNDE